MVRTIISAPQWRAGDFKVAPWQRETVENFWRETGADLSRLFLGNTRVDALPLRGVYPPFWSQRLTQCTIVERNMTDPYVFEPLLLVFVVLTPFR